MLNFRKIGLKFQIVTQTWNCLLGSQEHLCTHTLHHGQCTSHTVTREELDSCLPQGQQPKAFEMLALSHTGAALLSRSSQACASGVVEYMGGQVVCGESAQCEEVTL